MRLQAHFADQDKGRHEQRGSARRALRLDLAAGAPAAGEVAVTIRDLSLTGMLIETQAPLADGESFQIELPEAGNVESTVVWTGGDFYGCQFESPISPATLSGALLKAEAGSTDFIAPAEPADILAELQDINAHVQRITGKLERSIRRLKKDREGKADR